MKILYVHGFNGQQYGKSFNCLKSVADKHDGLQMLSLDYDETKISETIDKIYKMYINGEFDIIVGASYGGFIVMQCADIPRIVVNPCLLPIIELPKIGISNDIDDLEKYQNRITDYFDHDDYDMCVGLFCKDDELLGTKYITQFSKSFKHASIIPGSHHVTPESAEHIIDTVLNFGTK